MPGVRGRGRNGGTLCLFAFCTALVGASAVADGAENPAWLMRRETRFAEWKAGDHPKLPIQSFTRAAGYGSEVHVIPFRSAARTPVELWDDPAAPKLVAVPAGAFTMGAPRSERGSFEAERPQHRVEFREPFAVGKYQVTRGEFAEFVAETHYDATREGCQGLSGTAFQQSAVYNWQHPGFPQTDEHPVVCVSWNDAQAYIAWLTKKTGKSYRLPSEAEWEYSARGGTRTPYWWGVSVDAGCAFANMADFSAKSLFPFWGVAACNDRHVFTSPAGSYAANPAGLYDISGNVWQWMADCWTRSYSNAPIDGAPQRHGNCKVHTLRGGAWNDRPRGIRLGYRAKGRSEVRAAGIGFRVARSLAPSELNPVDPTAIARACDSQMSVPCSGTETR